MTEPVVFDHGRSERVFRTEAVCFNSLLGGVTSFAFIKYERAT
jgi:hypothetical protein